MANPTIFSLPVAGFTAILTTFGQSLAPVTVLGDLSTVVSKTISFGVLVERIRALMSRMLLMRFMSLNAHTLSGEAMRACAAAYFLSRTRVNSRATRPTACVLNWRLIVGVGAGLAAVDDVEVALGLGPDVGDVEVAVGAGLAVVDDVALAVGAGLAERGEAELLAGDGLAPDFVALPPHPDTSGSVAMTATSMHSRAIIGKRFMILLQSTVDVRRRSSIAYGNIGQIIWLLTHENCVV